MSVTGLAGMLNIKGLIPELIPPEEVFAGVAAPFHLRIRNIKRYLPSFLIRLESPGSSGAIIPLIAASGSAETTLTHTFAGRGRAGVGPITVSSPFPVNFFERYWVFPAELNIIVFPRLSRGIAVGDGREARQGGSNIHYQRGVDGELERIAPYSGGDPLRMIHWRLSARGDELLVKEFGRQSAQPLVIDLDAQLGADLEERISRAAWLVRRWVNERPVGLRFAGRNIPTEAGHRHGLKLLTELALFGKGQ